MLIICDVSKVHIRFICEVRLYLYEKEMKIIIIYIDSNKNKVSVNGGAMNKSHIDEHWVV